MQPPNLLQSALPEAISSSVPNASALAQEAERRCQQLETEKQLLEESLKAMIVERDRLRQQLAEVQEERDDYLRSLYFLTRKQITFDEQELREMEQNGLVLDQFIEALGNAEEIASEAN